MADLSASINFDVLLDFTQNKIILTDTGNYPPGVEPTLKGIVGITQPDGVSVYGTFVPTPDIVWDGTNLTKATKELRLTANGKPQQGLYTVVYQIYDGVDVTVRTKQFQVSYNKPTQNIQERFDVFTPVLQVTDATDYAVSNTTAAITRQWNVQIGTLTTKTGTNVSLDLAIGGVYYDADYIIDLSADVVYTSVSDPYLSIKDHFTSQLITEANTPPATDALLDYVNEIKAKVDAQVPCGDDCCKGQCEYILAFTLYRHIRDRICKHQTVGLEDYIQQLLNIYYGFVKVYVNLNVPILPYMTGDCEGSIGAPGFPILVKISNTTTPCSEGQSIVYINHSAPTFVPGDTLYLDINLTLPFTGYNLVVDQTTSLIYSLNPATGKVGAATGNSCLPGYPISVKLSSGSSPCAVAPITVYLSHNAPTFNIGDILWSDIYKSIPLTGFTLVVDPVTSLIHNISSTTGVVGAATGNDCIAGFPLSVKLSSTGSPCLQTPMTVYKHTNTPGFSVGDILYTDIYETIPLTGYTLIVDPVTSLIYNISSTTGQVGAATGNDCLPGFPISVKLGTASPCAATAATVYINHNAPTFSVGDVLYTDINKTIPVTGFTQVVELVTTLIYNISTTTGVVGAATGADCAVLSVNDLMLATNAGLLVNTAQVFTATGGVYGFGHIGVEDDHWLDVGKNGILYQQYKSDAYSFVFGFRHDHALAAFSTFKIALNVAAGGALYLLDTVPASTLVDTTYAIPVNKFIGIWKCAKSSKVVISDDGVHWVGLHLYRGYFFYTSTPALAPADHPFYPTCDAHLDSKLYYPKLIKHSDVNIAKLFIQEGNSIANGELPGGALSTEEIGVKTWYHLDTDGKWFFNKRAISGTTIQQHIDWLPTHVFPLVGNGFSKIIVAEYEGTNYMASTGTPHTGLECFNKFMEFANTALAYDPRICVLLYCCAASNVVPEVERVDFNNRLCSITETPRLKYVDFRSDPFLNDHNNTTYFWDHTHMTDAGYTLLGNYGKAKAALF